MMTKSVREQIEKLEVEAEIEQEAYEQSRRDGMLEMWKECMQSIDGVVFRENPSPGSVWSSCSRIIRDLKPSKVNDTKSVG